MSNKLPQTAVKPEDLHSFVKRRVNVPDVLQLGGVKLTMRHVIIFKPLITKAEINSVTAEYSCVLQH